MADLTIAVGGTAVSVHLGPAPDAVLDAAALAALAGKVSLADLASTASGKGAALVGIAAGGTLADAVKFVTPEMFGAVADGSAAGGTDCTAAINAADVYAAANGMEVWFPGQYHVTGQLLHSDNTVWRFQGGTIWMGRTNTGGGNYYEEAVLRGRTTTDWATLASDSATVITPATVGTGCTIVGKGAFRWTDAANAFAIANEDSTFMPVAYYLCDNLRVEKGITFECGWSAWTVLHYGDYCHWGADILGGENRPIHSDGFHSVGGDYGFLDDPLLTAGDDACAIGSVQFNLKGARGWTGRYRGFSRLGNAVKKQAYRFGEAATFANPLTGEVSNNNIAMKWVQLGKSFNSLCRIDTGADNYDTGDAEYTTRAEDAGLIHDNTIYIDGSDARNLGTPDELWPGENVTGQVLPGVSARGGENNKISGIVRFPAKNHLDLEGIGEGYEINLECPDTPNWIGDSGSNSSVTARTLFERENGTATAVVTRHSAGFHLNGRYEGGKAGGDNVSYTNVSGAITFDNLKLTGVTAGRHAFAAVGTSVGVDGGRLEVTPASASTTSDVFNTNVATAVYKVRDLAVDPTMRRVVTTPASVAAISFEAARGGTGRTTTINSGGAVTYADAILYLAGEGGLADSLGNVTGGYEGQICEFRARSPATEPITVSNAGNFSQLIPASYILDSAAKFLIGQWDATQSKWLLPGRKPKTGWTQGTGSASRGVFAAAAAGTASAAYVQAELQSALNRIAVLEARLLAVEQDIRSGGLIN